MIVSDLWQSHAVALLKAAGGNSKRITALAADLCFDRMPGSSLAADHRVAKKLIKPLTGLTHSSDTQLATTARRMIELINKNAKDMAHKARA